MTSGEGGMVSVRRRRDRAAGAAAAQPGHGAPVRERGRRLQHPDDRHPRRHRAGAADQGRRLDQRSARTNAAFLDGQPARASPPRRSPRAPCTSTTSTRSGSPTDRDGFAAALRDEHGVGSGVYYPIPNHRLRAVRSVDVDLPETERAARECLSLPVHPSLAEDDLERIVDRGQHPGPRRRLTGTTKGRPRSDPRAALRSRQWCSGGLLGLPEDLGDLVDLGEQLVGLGGVELSPWCRWRRPAWWPR